MALLSAAVERFQSRGEPCHCSHGLGSRFGTSGGT